MRYYFISLIVLLANLCSLAQAPGAGSTPISISEPGDLIDVTTISLPGGGSQTVLVCICSESICYTITADPGGIAQNGENDDCGGTIAAAIPAGATISISANGSVIASGALESYQNVSNSGNQLIREHVISYR